MFELLESLPAFARVLDLGARSGSFESPRGDLTIVRLDLEIPAVRRSGAYVSADAARMPFRDAVFDAVISNHSLEHFVEFEATLREIGRVLRPGGALYVAVPDTGTLSDRIYRWIGRGGGHVNPFHAAADVIGPVERLTGLQHSGTRPLISGFAFLNSHNFTGRAPLKTALFAFGNERFLAVFVRLLRELDRLFGARLSHYGWAFYFGSAQFSRSAAVWHNVCVRCGAGRPDEEIRGRRCPLCGGWNLFSSPKKAPPREMITRKQR
jgi:SAM-dependent methyltransferase